MASHSELHKLRSGEGGGVLTKVTASIITWQAFYASLPLNECTLFNGLGVGMDLAVGEIGSSKMLVASNRTCLKKLSPTIMPTRG